MYRTHNNSDIAWLVARGFSRTFFISKVKYWLSTWVWILSLTHTYRMKLIFETSDQPLLADSCYPTSAIPAGNTSLASGIQNPKWLYRFWKTVMSESFGPSFEIWNETKVIRHIVNHCVFYLRKVLRSKLNRIETGFSFFFQINMFKF